MGVVIRALSHTVVAGLVGATLVLAPAAAEAKRKKGPVRFVPDAKKGKERRQARRDKTNDRSEAGSRRGVLELSLGSVVGATAGLLIGRGLWEIGQSRRIEEDCAAGGEALECTFVSPGRQAKIAAGLNFGFAGVLGLASGFLLVRGVRIHRDYRTWVRNNPSEARLTVQPWASVRRPGGGLSLRLRF